MSFAAVAIGSLVASTLATIYTSRKTAKANKKAQKQAKLDAGEDARQARKAEVFAETEGLGQGQLGKVNLDDDLEEGPLGNRSRVRL